MIVHLRTFAGATLATSLLLLLLLSPVQQVVAGHAPDGDAGSSILKNGKITLTLRDTGINEVMEMLSRAAHVNILLSDNIKGKISLSLFEVSIDEAIDAIVDSAGYGVERRKGSYFIVERGEVGKNSPGGPTRLRTFKVQYSDPMVIAGILEKYLSGYGQVTTLPARRMLIVEDTPHFLDRIGKLLTELDREPRQILIEAQILEIVLKDSESYGLDWAKIFESSSRTITLGTQGLSNPGSAGLFLDYFSDDLELVLDALRTRDRMRTLSTPKILALEDQEAETIIGDRLGYNVTTTIDNVTTTSTEFLESGVILRVKPSVDEQERVLLEIHPEVSTGSVSDDGIPNQTTTEVTTTMLVESGKTVFIGGLIKRAASETREGIPVLGDIPGLGMLFSNKGMSSVNTELIVLITPHILDHGRLAVSSNKVKQVDRVSSELELQPKKIDATMSTIKRFEDMQVPQFDDSAAPRDDDSPIREPLDHRVQAPAAEAASPKAAAEQGVETREAMAVQSQQPPARRRVEAPQSKASPVQEPPSHEIQAATIEPLPKVEPRQQPTPAPIVEARKAPAEAVVVEKDASEAPKAEPWVAAAAAASRNKQRQYENGWMIHTATMR